MSKQVDCKNLQNLNEEDDDEEDDDYVPGNASESDENDLNEKEDDKLNEGKKKKAAKRKLKNKESDSDNEELENENDSDQNEKIKSNKSDEIKPVTEEEKKKADEIWSSFLKDVKSSKPSTSSVTQTANKYQQIEKKTETNLNSSPKTTINQSTKKDIFSSYCSNPESAKNTSESTGQIANSTLTDVSAKKPKPSGLASILDKINKQPKISTLEKSKLDWEEFKKAEKIEDDLSIHSKGKQSYLERQAFLERTDLRQFEIEKELRNKERKQRDAKY